MILIICIITCIFIWIIYNIQGIDPYGVIMYYNRESDEENYVNGHFTGLKWQCVEYARRWLITVKGATFEKVNNATDIWNLQTATLLDSKQVDFINAPITEIPQIGALLIYRKSVTFPNGHVSVVVKVHPNREVDVAEQNYSNKWQGIRRVNVKKENVIGWKIIKTK